MIDSRYRGLDELWTRPPDALIVTGTEPAQAQLRYEPYWPYLARLLEWAADHVPTTLLSCLASHASFLLFDGIERVPRPVKCSGVFEGVVETRSIRWRPGFPNWSPSPIRASTTCPRRPRRGGLSHRHRLRRRTWAGRWRRASRDGSLFVLCQGHPEYGTLSLLREYRRDVRRCLFGRGAAAYPRLPEGYLSEEAVATVEGFAAHAQRPVGRPKRAVAELPLRRGRRHACRTRWAAASATLYANWLRLARAARAASRRDPDAMRDETLAIHGGYTRRLAPGPSRFRSTRRSRTTSSTPTQAGAIMDLRDARVSLQPHQQPHRRRARAAARRARGRRRGARGQLRHGGGQHVGAQPARAPATTSSRCRSSTAPPTPTSPTSSPPRDRGALRAATTARVDRAR